MVLSWHIHGTFQTHPWYFPDTSMVLCRHIHGTLQTHLWYLPDTSMVLSRHIHGTFQTHPWFFPDRHIHGTLYYSSCTRHGSPCLFILFSPTYPFPPNNSVPSLYTSGSCRPERGISLLRLDYDDLLFYKKFQPLSTGQTQNYNNSLLPKFINIFIFKLILC